jgi:ubiquinone/menaquinone biosynthesis C-methylase UbiE
MSMLDRPGLGDLHSNRGQRGATMGASFDPDAFRDFERQGHDRIADSYTTLVTPITGLAISHLLDAAAVGPGTKVLDVACGPGFLSAAVKERGALVQGVDLSPRMVEIASRLAPEIGFHVGDIERLSFPNATFDAVVCNFGLGHFPRPEASVAECVRVLVPGGNIAFAWWDTLYRQRLQAIFREALTKVGARPSPRVPTGHDVFRFSDRQALRNLLEDAQLKTVSIQDFTSSIDVADAQQLWDIGMGSLAVTSSMILDATTLSGPPFARPLMALPKAIEMVTVFGSRSLSKSARDENRLPCDPNPSPPRKSCNVRLALTAPNSIVSARSTASAGSPSDLRL